VSLYIWGPEQVIVLRQPARTFVFRQNQAPDDLQIRIAAAESKGRPALAFRRVYQLQQKVAGNRALPAFASCSTLVLGCFVVQTYGTSVTGPVASPRRQTLSGPPTPVLASRA